MAGEAVDAKLEANIMHTIERYKNKRSWLDAVEYSLSTEGHVPAWTVGVQFSEIITVFSL